MKWKMSKWKKSENKRRRNEKWKNNEVSSEEWRIMKIMSKIMKMKEENEWK